MNWFHAGVESYRILSDIRDKIQHVYSILNRDSGFQVPVKGST
jgi:hypothetical protein